MSKNILLQIIIIGITIILLNGCVSYAGYYKVGLYEVERPQNVKERYGEFTLVNFEEEGRTKYSYEDSLLKITWLPLSTQFAFTLQNKSNSSFKIIWDEAVYVDVEGSSERVMHAGVKYTDRNNPQPPSIVVRNAKIDDIVAPTSYIYYVSGQYGGWRERPLFQNTATTPEELETVKNRYIGKTVKVLLPIQIEDTVNEYIFSFRVEDFIRYTNTY